jgi:hypothetical protein
MTEKTGAAGRDREATAPATTLYETAVNRRWSSIRPQLPYPAKSGLPVFRI